MSLPGEILQGIMARWALVLLRVYLGAVFLLAALPKIQHDSTPGLTAFMPNVPAFATVIAWGEMLVGVTLVLGLLTRFSAAFALVLALNYMFAKGTGYWTPTSNNAAFAAIALALLIGAAGRTMGLDALLARRWPRSPFW